MKAIASREKETQAQVQQLCRALLYEGYSLFPYHRAAVKNQKPVPFGAIYPAAYAKAHAAVNSVLQAECLIQAHSTGAAVTAQVRFLHLRSWKELGPGELAASPNATVGVPASEVPILQTAETYHPSGWLAVEREFRPECPSCSSAGSALKTSHIEISGLCETQPLRNPDGEVIGSRLETMRELKGLVTTEVQPMPAKPDCFKLAIRLTNQSKLDQPNELSRDEAGAYAFLAPHLILSVSGGEFISVLEPDDAWRPLVAECRNLGAWPVLVGRDNRTLLVSPIILHDYPEISPQSTGDLFDGSEIEEALLLHAAVMSDQEKDAIAASDDKLRAMIERIRQVTPQDLLNLHGVLHPYNPTGEPKP